MSRNETNIIVWALALLLPILPALLFFIPRSSTAEASSDDEQAKKSQAEKVPIWRKWQFKLTGAAAAYLVFASLAMYHRPPYVPDDIFTVWGTVDIDQGQRPQLNQLRFDISPPKYSDRDGTFSWKVIKQEDGLPTLSVIWADQKLIGNPEPIHLDPNDPFFDKEITKIAGHSIMVKKHFAMRAPPPPPIYNPSPSAAPASASILPSALTSANRR